MWCSIFFYFLFEFYTSRSRFIVAALNWKKCPYVQNIISLHCRGNNSNKFPVEYKPKNFTRVKTNEYQCNLCDKRFKKYLAVYQHIKKVHEKIYMKRVCETCGKVFASIHSYNKHYNGVHSDKDPYLCEVCGKSFHHYDSFKMHERIHIGNKCHKCPLCGKGFLEKPYMRKHMQTHYKV